MREGGENKKERNITPANANVSQLLTTRGLAFTLSELLEVYIVLCDLLKYDDCQTRGKQYPRTDEKIKFTHMTEINCLVNGVHTLYANKFTWQ